MPVGAADPVCCVTDDAAACRCVERPEREDRGEGGSSSSSSSGGVGSGLPCGLTKVREGEQRAMRRDDG